MVSSGLEMADGYELRKVDGIGGIGLVGILLMLE